MAGKSRVTAGEEQRNALLTLAHSRDRGEADRARAILLTLSGWTSPRIAESFSAREDTVRLWRSEFARGGVEALKDAAPGQLDQLAPASGPRDRKTRTGAEALRKLICGPSPLIGTDYNRIALVAETAADAPRRHDREAVGPARRPP